MNDVNSRKNVQVQIVDKTCYKTSKPPGCLLTTNLISRQRSNIPDAWKACLHIRIVDNTRCKINNFKTSGVIC